ncbi:hypothetical protein [Actinoplanes sp. NPDC051411]|uniref:hypothetical protein n=1 Tax=Actinoplanes sp. NPDC051411 TaxID=3155522 RepID=UPI0034193A1C
MTGGDVVPVPGIVLALDEADYCYGLGPIALRVTLVEPLAAGEEWLRITGREVHPAADGGLREVMIRLAAVPRATRPAGWRPRP